MKDVQSAKQLVQNMINMCKSVGFNLTKFMSNSKKLLATIPKEKRKEGLEILQTTRRWESVGIWKKIRSPSRSIWIESL